MVGNLFRTADRFETELVFVDPPLQNHKCCSDKTARIYSARLHEGGKSAKFFRVSLKQRSSLCDGANPAECFKFKAFNVKTRTDRLQTSHLPTTVLIHLIWKSTRPGTEPLADRQTSDLGYFTGQVPNFQ